jgi:hypothetical protein
MLFAWGFNSRFNSAVETLLLVNHKQITSESIATSYYVYWKWDCIIFQFELILITFAWGFNSRFNFAAETLLLVNHKKTTLESI